jgi:formamidopyrimidine-DNA glycosylase
MPESPEITYMVDELSKVFKNSILKDISINLLRFKSKLTNFKKFKNSLPLQIKEIKNQGKFVYMILSDDWSVGFGMGMTGHFWIPGVSTHFKTKGYTYNPKYNHISFNTSKGIFYFNDPRQFGHFYIYIKNNLESKLKTLGPDLIKQLPKISQTDFNFLLSKFQPKKVLADALLEQKFIAGVGNIYRAEAMYRAKLSPLRTIGSLNDNDKKRLKNALVYVGKKSYLSQKRKNKLHTSTFKIYGNPEAKQVKRKGRTIWYDPKIQK